MHSIIVQNALPHRLLGVGTSSVQFFRQIGGTMGIAIFGAILLSTFATNLNSNDVAGSERLAERPQILLDPDALDRFRGEVEAETPGSADAAVAAAREALAGATSDIFMIATVLGVVTTIVALALPHVTVRGQSEMAGGDGGAPPGGRDTAPPGQESPARSPAASPAVGASPPGDG